MEIANKYPKPIINLLDILKNSLPDVIVSIDNTNVENEVYHVDLQLLKRFFTIVWTRKDGFCLFDESQNTFDSYPNLKNLDLSYIVSKAPLYFDIKKDESSVTTKFFDIV
jgi:hypothetical protein